MINPTTKLIKSPNDVLFIDLIKKPTAKGVISRISFIHYLIFFVANLVIWYSLYIDGLVQARSELEFYFLIVYALVIVYFTVCLVFAMIRRYHDAGYSGKIIYILGKDLLVLCKPTKYLDNSYAPELEEYYRNNLSSEQK